MQSNVSCHASCHADCRHQIVTIPAKHAPFQCTLHSDNRAIPRTTKRRCNEPLCAMRCRIFMRRGGWQQYGRTGTMLVHGAAAPAIDRIAAARQRRQCENLPLSGLPAHIAQTAYDCQSITTTAAVRAAIQHLRRTYAQSRSCWRGKSSRILSILVFVAASIPRTWKATRLPPTPTFALRTPFLFSAAK